MQVWAEKQQPEAEEQAPEAVPAPVQECCKRLEQAEKLLRNIGVQIELQAPFGTVHKQCREPLWHEQVPLSVYLRQEQHRMRLSRAQLRLAS